MDCSISDKIQINTSNDEATAMIREAIANETPFAYTKYGDGESIILQTVMGRPPGIKPETTILQNFQHLHSFYRKIHRNWGVGPKGPIEDLLTNFRLCEPILSSLTHSNLVGVHNGIPDFFIITNPEYKACSNHVVYNKLADPKKLDDFFQGVDVRIISRYGETLRQKIQPLTKSKISVSTLPPRFNLKQAQNYITKMPGFPEPLVLWGGGGGVKNLGIHFRDTFGKTCIDIGSIVDAWSGILSRKAYKPGGVYQHLVIK